MSERLGGLWQLLLLAVRTRFRFGGAYWRWRNETAFGADAARRPPLADRVHAALEYGRWIHRMKRLR